MSQAAKIRANEREAILLSLGSGVVPRIGQQHIQVGRAPEVSALVEDIDRIAAGGAAIRFIIGEYGSGKTFFLNLVRSIALERKLVTARADLTPDRRLHASGGQARTLYAELMKNLATRGKPDGGALSSLVERFVTSSLSEAQSNGEAPQAVIQKRLNILTEMVGGYDFAEVIAAYWRGYDTGNDTLQSDAIRWLRAEFTTKTDARQALGVRTIIDDAGVYDHLKLMARFVRLCGYNGLLVCLDELVNLYKLANSQARKSNYEQVLRILNDTISGGSGIGFVLGGTPEFLMDTKKGLYSYEALQSRLAENPFAKDGLVDYSGPVLRLANLSPEDLFVLLQNIRHVQASGEPGSYLISDKGIEAFMRHCSEKVGDAHFRTPRNSVKAFVSLLAVLDQNPGLDWEQLVGGVELEEDRNPDLEPLPTGVEDEGADGDGGDELASFRI